MDPRRLIRANKYYERGNYRRALESYQAILNEHQNDPLIRERLARCYYELGHLENSRQECALAIKLNNETIDAYRYLSFIFEKESNLEEAEKILRYAIDLNPNSASLYNTLGVMLGNRSKLEESIAAYQKAIELDSSYWRAHFNLATNLRATKQFHNATRANLRAFRIAPSLQTAYWTLVSYEFMHPKWFAAANFALMLTLILFRSVYLIPVSILFAVAVAYRTSFWLQSRFVARSIGTAIMGVLILLWYFYGVLVK
jgi:tetratricopeptide (TPR) repeat protein